VVFPAWAALSRSSSSLILALKPDFQAPNMPLTQAGRAQAAIKSGVKMCLDITFSCLRMRTEISIVIPAQSLPSTWLQVY
jgi:hypothetical protein